MLRALGEKYGFDVDQLPPVEVSGHVVSSTCLRELIGRKPTFGDYGLSIESFLLDTDLNLYGSELRLDFVARLRDEKRFESADALVAQIRTDVARARDLLTMYF